MADIALAGKLCRLYRVLVDLQRLLFDDFTLVVKYFYKGCSMHIAEQLL